LAEALAASVLAGLACRALSAVHGGVAAWRWSLGPAALVILAAGFMRWRRIGWMEAGVIWPAGGRALWGAALAAAAVLGAAFGGAALLDWLGVWLPLRPSAPQDRFLAWALHQFLYVAVSEELFFRGYVQAVALRWLKTRSHVPALAVEWGATAFSAASFGLAHVLALGSLAGAAVVAPGILFGWLRFRTGSLAPPVVAHGIANVGYALIGAWGPAQPLAPMPQ